MNEHVSLIRYEAARAALDEALRVDEVQEIRTDGLRLKAYAKIAKDKKLQADAAAIILRAERKLGVLIQSAKETGQLKIGRPSKSNVLSGTGDDSGSKENGSEEEPISRATLEEAGIDKKLSSRAQKWARMGDGEFDDKLESERERILSGGATAAAPINGARSVMAGRSEPPTGLDYFPTPPWATRALIEDVLRPRGYTLDGYVVREPACGEGHISGVLEEVIGDGEIAASDVFDYSRDDVSPPGWTGRIDYLDETLVLDEVDWTITNPPFEDRALPFVKRALATSTRGVAMFFRSQWAVEGVERYNELFRDNPPTIEAYFVERVNLCRGRWDPQGSTATAYCWLVWIKGQPPAPMHRIEPGRRIARARDTDVARFTTHPVHSLNSAGSNPRSIPRPTEGPAAGDEEQPASSPTSSDSSIAAAPEGAGTVASGGGVPGQDASSAAQPLSRDDTDGIIRRGYAREPKASIAELMAATGLSKDQVKKAAGRLGLASRENQRAAVSASNRRRAAN